MMDSKVILVSSGGLRNWVILQGSGVSTGRSGTNWATPSISIASDCVNSQIKEGLFR